MSTSAEILAPKTHGGASAIAHTTNCPSLIRRKYIVPSAAGIHAVRFSVMFVSRRTLGHRHRDRRRHGRRHGHGAEVGRCRCGLKHRDKPTSCCMSGWALDAGCGMRTVRLRSVTGRSICSEARLPTSRRSSAISRYADVGRQSQRSDLSATDAPSLAAELLSPPRTRRYV
jgi:hypothetical protein